MMNRLYPFLILMILVFTGCKYEEGPFISFREAETRMVGSWKLGRTFKNGEPYADGELSANNPGSYYYFYYEGQMTVSALVNGHVRTSNQGFWRFQNRNKELEISFQLPGETYYYKAVIKKLTMSELRYEYYDSDGNLWRLEFYSRSHY